jgi:predicted ATPase with chaperone activity
VKVGLTIADLAGSDVVERDHVREALGFRAMWQQREVSRVG